jgi:hypothetical protein
MERDRGQIGSRFQPVHALERGGGATMQLGPPHEPDRPVDRVAGQSMREAIAAARRIVDEAGR